MPSRGRVELDVLILGGGAAGLWILDDLHRAGFDALGLEAQALGTGQTVASQGIIHGGLKYSLGGLVGDSGRAIRAMPELWRRCLAGEREPDLSRTEVRADHCYLWQTASLRSRVAMFGARAGLLVRPRRLAADDRPAALASCPGTVARLDEQVIDPASFVADLAGRHGERLLQIDAANGLTFESSAPGNVGSVTLRRPDRSGELVLAPRLVILAAGAGNESLAAQLNLEAPMQRRPLHMIMARGDLPAIYGHCVDGAATRVTITSARDNAGRTVWQIGGQISEEGVESDAAALAAHARQEIAAVLPDVNLAGVEWSTYRADRAEPRTPGRHRPASAHAVRTGDVIVAWPTKLALVPRLAELARELIEESPRGSSAAAQIPDGWPRPAVARPPWETETSWIVDP